MKEQNYAEGSMRKEPQGKQRSSWLGIEVKSEYFVQEEEQEEKVAREERMDAVWEREAEKGKLNDER